MGKKADNAILGARIGHVTDNNQVEISTKIEGLLLSQIVYKDIDFFKPNPCNSVFDALKTEQQLDALLKDIDESRAILNPLIAMPDGILIEGHSRLEIAKRLEVQGKGIGKLPVRIITTPLLPEEIKQRVYLGNLSRFEIDEDTRISLYAEIWPGYFNISGKSGRKSDHGDTITASMLSQKLGKSVPQIKRDAAIFRNARKKTSGSPSVADIKESRKELNEERKLRERKKTARKVTQSTASSLVDRETSLISDLKINGKWNFAIEVERFVDYVSCLSRHDMDAPRIVVEYLIERLTVVERANEKVDSVGLSDL